VKEREEEGELRMHSLRGRESEKRNGRDLFFFFFL
jgi:hypothetical protein